MTNPRLFYINRILPRISPDLIRAVIIAVVSVLILLMLISLRSDSVRNLLMRMYSDPYEGIWILLYGSYIFVPVFYLVAMAAFYRLQRWVVLMAVILHLPFVVEIVLLNRL
jgi:hypothetical protein